MSTLWLYEPNVGGMIVRTQGDDETGYRTEILEVLGSTHDGQGKPELDVDGVWERETLSRTSALLAHDEARWRAFARSFEETLEECCACGADIDPLDEDAEGGHCGRCVGEMHALVRAFS